jgi:hypothetical protein
MVGRQPNDLDKRAAQSGVGFGKFRAKDFQIPVKPVSAVEKGTRPKTCSTCKGSR